MQGEKSRSKDSSTMKTATTIHQISSEAHEPGEFTLRKIRCGHEESFLRRGSAGPGVSMIQELLDIWAKSNGREAIPESEHGVFGSHTETLLKEFQKSVAMDNHYRPVTLSNDPKSHSGILLATKGDGILGTETLCLLECSQAGRLSPEAWDRMLRATRQNKASAEPLPESIRP